MSTALITPHALSGTIQVPPSKSYMHRAIICALLAGGISEIYPVDFSNDVMATINVAKSLGSFIETVSDHLIIDSRAAFLSNYVNLNCYESASTLRFLIPIVCAHGIEASFEGINSLNYRPINVYTDILPEFGIHCALLNGKLPLTVSGKLQSGKYIVPGNISSQFISGLLFALPLLKEDSEICLSTVVESEGYVNMTIKTMESFGIKVLRTSSGFKVPGNQKYRARKCKIEGDWSQAAFFMSAGAIGEPIKICGLSRNSLQGDKAIAKLLCRMGADITYSDLDNSITVSAKKLSGINIFSSQIPDLVPILSILAACAEGKTHILGASRLRYKESDRLKALYNGIKTLDVNIIETDDGLLIDGVKKFNSANLDGFNDHRIVMAFSIAAIKANGKLCISGAECISKSYPSFFEDYNRLGGIVNVLNI